MNKLIRITTIPGSYRNLLKGQLRYMNQYYEVVAISSPGDALYEAGKNEGVRTIAVKMTRTLSPLKDLISLWKLYWILKKEKPFIVHTHTPKAGTIGMLASKIANIPHRLHTVAGMPLLESKGLKRILLDFVEKLTYACATKVYPNSHGLYQIILKNNYTVKSKLKVLAKGSSNGIDTLYFDRKNISEDLKKSLKNDLNLSDDNFVFLYVGRIVKDKGINELISAFLQLNLRYPKIKLILVGGFERELSPLLPQTEMEIESNKSIIYVGYQIDVRPYYLIADVLTFPSYREGFPNVVMQAGAMELPCIVTDINGCNEIIEAGVNGLIIPPQNKEQLQAKMQLLLENSKLRNKLKQNARNMITSRYEQKMVWEALLKEYKNLENNV